MASKSHSKSKSDLEPARVPQSKKRRVLFRLAAIAFGLACIGVLEIGLRVAGVDRYFEPAAPLVGFSEIQPLFVKNAAGDRFEIPTSRQAFFRPESFAAQKAPDEYRIFCFGGSTVQGRPYSIETSFTTWLELNLKAADPDRNWEAVNCGGVSYASYRLVPLLRESLQYDPDLFVVYTGHNEFLEERTYESIKRQPKWMRRWQDRVLQLRIAGLLRSFLPDKKDEKQEIDMPAEVDALLDYQGGLAKYHRDDVWRDGVIYEYEQNLRKLVEIARAADVPIVLVNPVCNVADTPPFKVELPSDFSAEQKAEFERQWEAAKNASWDDPATKQTLVNRVLEMDDRHAEAHFLRARIYEAQGDYAKARESYLRAKDEDICPLRMLESMHDVLKNVAVSTSTPLIDVRKLFEEHADHGLPGDNELIDHVHPRIEGHQFIADELFHFMVRQQIVTTTAQSSERRKDLYKANYKSLPDSYFPESVERLRGLQRWASGRVTRLKIPE